MNAALAPDPTPHVFRIAPLEITFDSRDPETGFVRTLETDSSRKAFDRLELAARNGESVLYFVAGGQRMVPQSVAALNSYLRTYRVTGSRVRMPFDRVNTALNSRFAWVSFLSYLGAKFIE